MRFEREKDIPAFRLTASKEARRELRREAQRRDPWIWRLIMVMMGSTFLVIVPSVKWLPLLDSQGRLISDLVACSVGLAFAFSFNALFITPRIRRALERGGDLPAR